MANTTWNPSDRVNATLSNANLTSTPTGQMLVRSVLSVTSGKYYFEIKFAATGNSAGVGIANSSATSGSVLNGSGVAYAINDGTTYVNGVAQAVVGGFGVNGACCIALDMGAKLIWFRSMIAGFWNSTSSSTPNPATGVGGYSISGLTGGATTIFAYAGGTNASASPVTANFGDSAFVGIVPAGYAPGLPGTVSALQARAMVLA
jgi:hypothetical protein